MSPVVEMTLTSVENVIGTVHDDLLTGNADNNVLSGRNGRDVLDGGGGDDTLVGGSGNDTLTGGTGRDAFVFGVLGQDTDTIQDFVVGDDRIELTHSGGPAAGVSFHFANSLTAGDAGAVTISALTNGVQIVQGDWNADGIADFTINVHTNAALTSTDFIL